MCDSSHTHTLLKKYFANWDPQGSRPAYFLENYMIFLKGFFFLMDLRVGNKMFKYFQKVFMGFLFSFQFSLFNQVHHII